MFGLNSVLSTVTSTELYFTVCRGLEEHIEMDMNLLFYITLCSIRIPVALVLPGVDAMFDSLSGW